MPRTELRYPDGMYLAIASIEEDVTGISFGEFTKDRRRKDAVIRDFEVIGEARKKLSEDRKVCYPIGAWKRNRVSGCYCSWQDRRTVSGGIRDLQKIFG